MAICVSRVLLDGLQKKERLLVVYLEVVGERENWPAGGRLSPRVSPSRAPVFSCAHYFQAPATQATKHLASVACSSKIIPLVLPSIINPWQLNRFIWRRYCTRAYVTFVLTSYKFLLLNAFRY